MNENKCMCLVQQKIKLEYKMKKKNAWVLGKDIEALGILKGDPGTRLGFEPASGPDTLSLPLPTQSNMLALLNAT